MWLYMSAQFDSFGFGGPKIDRPCHSIRPVQNVLSSHIGTRQRLSDNPLASVEFVLITLHPILGDWSWASYPWKSLAESGILDLNLCSQVSLWLFPPSVSTAALRQNGICSPASKNALRTNQAEWMTWYILLPPKCFCCRVTWHTPMICFCDRPTFFRQVALRADMHLTWDTGSHIFFSNSDADAHVEMKRTCTHPFFSQYQYDPLSEVLLVQSFCHVLSINCSTWCGQPWMSELSYDMFRVVGVVTHTYIPIQESPLEQSMVDYCDLLCAQMID